MPSWLDVHLASENLTPGQRRILEKMRLAPGDFLMIGVKEFARKTGASPASVTRCVRALGFAHYDAFQKAMKEELLASSTLTNAYNYLMPQHEAHGQESELLFAEQQALQRSLQDLNHDALHKAACEAVAAERIYLLGYGSSSPLMHYLQYRLERLGMVVINLENASNLTILAERCVHMRKKDMVIVSSFRGIYTNIEHLLQYAAAFRIPTLAFTENSDSRISALARWRLPIYRAVTRGFKSLAAPMSIIHLFAMELAKTHSVSGEAITRRLEWFTKYEQELNVKRKE